MYYSGHKPNKCPMGTMPYMIKAGDTFYSIAIRYNTTVAALIAANPNVNPNALYIGQMICIPMPQPPCPGGNYYTVKAGDTFYSIARRYNVSLDALLNANPNVNPDALYIGQVICIPGVTPPPQPQPCPEGTIAYIIKAGDTIYSIARRYNISVDALIAANPNVDPDNLRIGQQICVPIGTPPPQPCPEGTNPYTIRSGDTFFSLARRFNTTVEAIQAANPGVDPDNLQIGQVICMPGTPTPPPPPSECPAGTTPYTIRSGDTLYSISRRYGITVEDIEAVNPGIDPDNLQIGQIICIPIGTPPQDCPEGTTAYIIRSGDTFYLLARRYNTTVEAIQAANPNVNPNNLQIGQQICIPTE